MRFFRTHRRVFGAAAAWVFIAQSIVGGQMPMHEVASVKDPILGELIICSSRIPGRNADLPTPTQNKPQCSHCMHACSSSCTGGALPVALRSVAMVVRTASAATVPSAITTPPDYVSLATSHPRAPPSLIG